MHQIFSTDIVCFCQKLSFHIYSQLFLIGKTPKGSPKEKPNPEDEDPMKWIEENIPEAGDNPLPVLDSDEELENAKFEISKMQ